MTMKKYLSELQNSANELHGILEAMEIVIRTEGTSNPLDALAKIATARARDIQIRLDGVNLPGFEADVI